MSGIGKVKGERLGVQNAVESRNHLIHRVILVQNLIGSAQKHGRGDETMGLAAQGAPGHGHHQRGGQAFAGDVSHDNAPLVGTELDEVIKITAGFPGRFGAAGNG